MSNLIKAAEELEYVPKEDLIRMAETGDSRFPPYLVLSEIQRRTQNEKAYSAMQPQPTTTVAEEKVAEFAQSGLGGMVSPPFSPPENIPMSPPMQMAASGGLTGYANKGKTETTGSKIKEFLTAPLRGIEELGRLRYEAGRNMSNQLRENASMRADIRNDLITKSLPVIKGEKTLEEFKNEMRELYNDDFIKDDKGYRNSIKNYYYNFEQKFLPRFQKEIAETGQMPKDVIKFYDDYENFRNSKQYLNRFNTGYERPDLSLPEKMQEKQGGGLIGYKNQGRTTYQGTFSKIDDPAFSKVFAPFMGLAGPETRGIMSSLQSNPSYANVSNILLTTPLAGFGPREGYDENQLRKDLTLSLLEGEEAFKTKLSEAKGENRISNIQEKQILDAYIAPPIVTSNENGSEIGNKDSSEIRINEGDDGPPPSVTTTPTTDVFGTLDELKKRMKDVEYKSPTADDLRSDRTAETLMYLGSLIAGSTDRKQFGQGLADLTSKVVASKRADDRFLNEAKLKERGLLSSDIQLATALETLKAKAVQAKNTQMKNDIDLAQVLTVRLQTAIGDEKTLIENQINSLISPYISGGINVASQVDVDNIVSGTKS